VLQSVSNCAKRSIEQDGVIADDKRAILFKLWAEGRWKWILPRALEWLAPALVVVV